LTELVIAGGTVGTPDGPRLVDVHISDGVIVALEEPNVRHPAGARVVDAGGMYVMPGGIDVHVHGRDPGFPEKEDFGTLTRAAAAGGVTTVIDMPNTIPGVDSGGVLESKAALAHSKARVDFGLWALIRSTSTADQLEELARAGAVGFKAYLGYAFSLSRKQVMYVPDATDPDLEAPPDYGTLLRLAPVIAALGLPLVIHAEDPGILSAFRRPLESYADVLASRPPEAMRDGSHLSLETCPQYLWRSDDDFAKLGTLMKMYPPVRTPADRQALIDGVERGVIAVVATDHAPHTDAEKAMPLEDAPAGSPGVQTLYLSCLELAKRMGDVWKAQKWVCEAPAVLIGVQERKGKIAPGFDADLAIVDPGRGTVFKPALMKSKQKHGVLEGLGSSFSIVEVYVRGRPVVRDGRAIGEPIGRMVKPS
jgi:allantoinase